jgi:hypothetical protein
MNWYKGTGQIRIFLVQNVFIGLSIPWIWFLEACTYRRRQEGKQGDWKIVRSQFYTMFKFTSEVFA